MDFTRRKIMIDLEGSLKIFEAVAGCFAGSFAAASL
jgi:hypothetical protein